ncbi:MAG: ATP-binding protein [Bacillota bacterium]|nr:ATP-binding protein [Bacillota bacterium]
MLLLNIEIDNFFAFNNFKMNFAYPKKIVNSTIANEHLEGYPNFRYRKVNILMGSNATGKTTMGRMLMSIFNALRRKTFGALLPKRNNLDAKARFSIDFISYTNQLWRVTVVIHPVEGQSSPYSASSEQVEVFCVPIRGSDSYEKCIERLEANPGKFRKDLEDVTINGWKFTFPRDPDSMDDVSGKVVEDARYLNVLKSILMTLDPAITDVVKVDDADDSYSIVLDGKNLLMQEGVVALQDRLSTGTIAGIDIASMVYAILMHKNGFYYCDEKFSFIQSDIETALLSLMISGLGSNEQLFFTTHNLEVADLDLPNHSFWFMRKSVSDETFYIEAVPVSKYLKKSSDSVKLALENDIFATAPDLSLLYSLEELE